MGNAAADALEGAERDICCDLGRCRGLRPELLMGDDLVRRADVLALLGNVSKEQAQLGPRSPKYQAGWLDCAYAAMRGAVRLSAATPEPADSVTLTWDSGLDDRGRLYDAHVAATIRLGGYSGTCLMHEFTEEDLATRAHVVWREGMRRLMEGLRDDCEPWTLVDEVGPSGASAVERFVRGVFAWRVGRPADWESDDD